MARLTPVSQRQFVDRLRALGFEGPYAGGRHPQMRRGEITLLTPSPYEGDIGVGLLSQAGVSREAGQIGWDTGQPKLAEFLLEDGCAVISVDNGTMPMMCN